LPSKVAEQKSMEELREQMTYKWHNDIVMNGTKGAKGRTGTIR